MEEEAEEEIQIIDYGGEDSWVGSITESEIVQTGLEENNFWNSKEVKSDRSE